MFKKTLAAAAILAAFAGSALAADIQLYGRFSIGLNYTNSDVDIPDDGLVSGDAKSHSFTMNSGDYTGSRFGLRGAEEFGNGWKVGFVLENGFSGDSGELGDGDRIFDREAIVYADGPWGKFAMGRVGIFTGDGGSFALGGELTPFGTGWNNVGSQSLLWGAGISSRYDNMVTYLSPTFAGFKVIAQYSFGSNTDAETGDIEGTEDTNRYYGVGLAYAQGPASFVLGFDAVNKKNEHWIGATTGTKYEQDDTYRVVAGGSWDFGMVRPYFAAAYFKDGDLGSFGGVYDQSLVDDSTDPATSFDLSSILTQNYDGYALALGASVPLGGGTFKAMVGYMDAEYQGPDAASAQWDMLESEKVAVDVKRWMIGAGYEYPFSKRTSVYVGGGYFQDDVDIGGTDAADGEPYKGAFKPKTYMFLTGMTHYF